MDTLSRSAASAKPLAPPAFAPSERREAALLRLPTWARTTEARLLLSLIQIERPERDRVLTRMFDGTPADYGYRGKNAAKLRAIFAKTYEVLMDWSCAAMPDREAFDSRRDAVIAYGRQFGADAVIARVLGGTR